MDQSKLPGDGTIDSLIAHFGTKGMHWGVRKEVGSSPAGPTAVTFKERKPGKSLKTTGGQGAEASADAKKVAVSKQTAKKSSLDSLSTKDLQDMVLRMNLEQQYSGLVDKPNPNMNKGQKMAKKLVVGAAPMAVVAGASKVFKAGDPRLAMALKVGEVLLNATKKKK